MNYLRSRLRLRYLLFASVMIIEVLGLLPLIAQIHLAEYDEAISLDIANSIHTTGTPIWSIGARGIYFFDRTPLYIYFISPITGNANARVLSARWLTSIVALGCIGLVFLCGEQVKNTLQPCLCAIV